LKEITNLTGKINKFRPRPYHLPPIVIEKDLIFEIIDSSVFDVNFGMELRTIPSFAST
jgi:hypothetical protein